MTTTRRQPHAKSRPQHHTSVWAWVGFLSVPAILVALVVVSSLTEVGGTAPTQAVPFVLEGTDGRTVSLDQSLADGDALLYFSMGVGCDGCFAQIPELEAAVAERGLTLVPIMVDPPDAVAHEAARFGIDRPILIDQGARVASAYGMVGIYGHSDRPSHSFALVRQNGEVAWVRHYAEMFVAADALFAELDDEVGA
ncbi:MAG TPA: redoxin family protein [Acidimicrobiia bacterium]